MLLTVPSPRPTRSSVKRAPNDCVGSVGSCWPGRAVENDTGMRRSPRDILWDKSASAQLTSLSCVTEFGKQQAAAVVACCRDAARISRLQVVA
jgi:hypothetical protein